MTWDTSIDERVSVWAFFDKGIFPVAMNWRRRLVKFDKLILTTTKKVGDIHLVDIICASDTSNYELEYNSSTYIWKVKRVISKP